MLINPKMETLPRDELESLQLRRLQNVCARVYANVPFYRKRFDEVGIKPDDIHSLEDLKRLPFTEKQDLRDNFPFGLCAVPREHITRVQASSGTTGKAVALSYTQRDVDNWKECAARGEQAILLMNRRGYHSFVSCRTCGYVVKCPNCDISMTYHLGDADGKLRCHYCGTETLPPAVCPECGFKADRDLLRKLGGLCGEENLKFV